MLAVRVRVDFALQNLAPLVPPSYGPRAAAVSFSFAVFSGRHGAFQSRHAVWHNVPLAVLSVRTYAATLSTLACWWHPSTCVCVCVYHMYHALSCNPVPQIEQTADGKPVNLGESKLWGAKRFLGYTKQQPSPREVSIPVYSCIAVLH